MYAITEKKKTLPDGTTITTWAREVVDNNILEVEAGTTGHCGGDTGHGGRTYFRIEDLAGTDIQVSTLTVTGDQSKGLEVFLGGDSELDTVIEALAFIVQVLKDQRAGHSVKRIMTLY